MGVQVGLQLLTRAVAFRYYSTTVPEELMAATRSLPSPFLVTFSTCYCYEKKIEEV